MYLLLSDGVLYWFITTDLNFVQLQTVSFFFVTVNYLYYLELNMVIHDPKAPIY